MIQVIVINISDYFFVTKISELNKLPKVFASFKKKGTWLGTFTNFSAMFSFDPPESIRKPFLMFFKEQKETFVGNTLKN